MKLTTTFMALTLVALTYVSASAMSISGNLTGTSTATPAFTDKSIAAVPHNNTVNLDAPCANHTTARIPTQRILHLAKAAAETQCTFPADIKDDLFAIMQYIDQLPHDPSCHPYFTTCVGQDEGLWDDWKLEYISDASWPASFDQERLKHELKGCGLMTKWNFLCFNPYETDQSILMFNATFRMPKTMLKGCIERAVVSSGGSIIEECSFGGYHTTDVGK